MGPFYEKYIKKMSQMFVKDRVRRLKETFEVARKGVTQLSSQHNLETSSVGKNDSLHLSNAQNQRTNSSEASENE